MNNPNDYDSAHYDDEISLVDLATTFIRRRRVFYGVFGVIVGFALLYTLLFVGEVREYSTLVQLAEKSDDEGNKPLEPPQSVITSIEGYWIPELQTEFQTAEGRKIPFKISAVNPDKTNLIKLSSKASPEWAEKVKAYHQKLVSRIKERQTDLLNRQKRELEQRVASLNKTLDELSQMQVSGEAQAQLIHERTSLLSEIESTAARIKNLQPSKALVVGRQSLDNKGSSKTFILALAIVLGLSVGVFATFLAEFGAQVRRAMKADS